MTKQTKYKIKLKGYVRFFPKNIYPTIKDVIVFRNLKVKLDPFIPLFI